jgi:hypothetical protein
VGVAKHHIPRRFCADALPPGPLQMTTYIKTPETNRYVTLARDVDLRALAAGRDAAAAIPACR